MVTLSVFAILGRVQSYNFILKTLQFYFSVIMYDDTPHNSLIYIYIWDDLMSVDS